MRFARWRSRVTRQPTIEQHQQVHRGNRRRVPSKKPSRPATPAGLVQGRYAGRLRARLRSATGIRARRDREQQSSACRTHAVSQRQNARAVLTARRRSPVRPPADRAQCRSVVSPRPRATIAAVCRILEDHRNTVPGRRGAQQVRSLTPPVPAAAEPDELAPRAGHTLLCLLMARFTPAVCGTDPNARTAPTPMQYAMTRYAVRRTVHHGQAEPAASVGPVHVTRTARHDAQQRRAGQTAAAAAVSATRAAVPG